MADNVVEYGIEVKDNSADALSAFQRNVEAANKQLEGLSARLAEISKANVAVAASSKENAGATEALKRVTEEISRGFNDLFGALRKIEENTKEATAATKDLIDVQERAATTAKTETKAVDDEAAALERCRQKIHEVAEAARKAEADNKQLADGSKQATAATDSLATANQRVDKASRMFRGTTALLRGDLVGFVQGLKGVSAELAGKLAVGAAAVTIAFQQLSAVFKKCREEAKAFYELEIASRLRGIQRAVEAGNRAMERRIELINKNAASAKSALDAELALAKAQSQVMDASLDREEARRLHDAKDDAGAQNQIRRDFAIQRANAQQDQSKFETENESERLRVEEQRLQEVLAAKRDDLSVKSRHEKRANADREVWEMLQQARQRDGSRAAEFFKWAEGRSTEAAAEEFRKNISGETLNNMTINTDEQVLKWNKDHAKNAANASELDQKVSDLYDNANAAAQEREKVEKEIEEAESALAAIAKQREVLQAKQLAAEERADKAREDAQRQFDEAEAERVKAEKERAEAADEKAKSEAAAEKKRADSEAVRAGGIRVGFDQKHNGSYGGGPEGFKRFAEAFFGRSFSSGADFRAFRDDPANKEIVAAAKTQWLHIRSNELDAEKTAAEQRVSAAKEARERLEPERQAAIRNEAEVRERTLFDERDVVREKNVDKEAEKEAKREEKRKKRAQRLIEQAEKWEKDSRSFKEGGHEMHLTPFQQKAVDMLKDRRKQIHEAEQKRLDIERQQREAEQKAAAGEQRQKEALEHLQNIDKKLQDALILTP